MNTILYFIVYREIQKILKNQELPKDVQHKRIIKLQLKLCFIVAGFTLIRLPSIINRVYQLFDTASSIFVLELLHAIASPLQGFVNSIIYGYSKKGIADMSGYVNLQWYESRNGSMEVGLHESNVSNFSKSSRSSVFY